MPRIDRWWFALSDKHRRGILLVNLGSPASSRVSDVRRYLRQFLMDPFVIDVPTFIRFFLVYGLIVPLRERKSSKAYHAIWRSEGSPLLAISRSVQQKLQERLDEPVSLAMRYGEPSIRRGLESLFSCSSLEEILLIPLYPHYARASYETAVMEVEKQLRKFKREIRLHVFPPFYDHPLYIEALVESAKKILASGYDHVLMSYHGLPVRHLKNLPPEKNYREHVFKTTESFVTQAKIPAGKYSVSFQSRLRSRGHDPWLLPDTAHEIVRLAKNGVKKLVVISPAFVTDCLETLEELGIRGKQAFMEAGGEEFRLIPCLNDHPAWIDTLTSWCLMDAPHSTSENLRLASCG